MKNSTQYDENSYDESLTLSPYHIDLTIHEDIMTPERLIETSENQILN